MAYTYSKIATYTVGSGGIPSVSFLNIPQNYTDLILKISLRATGATSGGFLTFNSNTTGYSERVFYGTGSTTGVASNSGAGLVWVFETVPSTYTSNTFSNGAIYIPGYTSSNYKSVSANVVQENNATASDIYSVAGVWANSSSINSISVASGSNFAQHSTFHLYGIKAEI
jgi:hypothetical protein